MDSITQAALGAAIGEAVLGKKIGNKGALVGAIIATIPDLDVVLFLVYSKFEMLSIHRGFSHSIVFSILGAFIIAFLLGKMRWLKVVEFKTLVFASWLCLFTHILLDAFTSYGTQLFLPFSNRRVGLDSINVVDPFYTEPLIVGVFLSLWFFKSKKRRSVFNTYGLLISSLYLVFTLVNKELIKSKISTRLAIEQVECKSLLTIPVGIGNVNWYGIAKGQDSIYVLQSSMLSTGDSPIDAFPINEEYLSLIDKEYAETMRWFSKGYYTVEKVDGNIRIYNLQVDTRGVVDQGTWKAPTLGYFEISNLDGVQTFSSGTIKKPLTDLFKD